VSFVNVPLDADVYYVQTNDISRENMMRLRKAWERMNESLPKPKMLVVLPEEVELKRMPSSVLRDWMAKCQVILTERGE